MSPNRTVETQSLLRQNLFPVSYGSNFSAFNSFVLTIVAVDAPSRFASSIGEVHSLSFLTLLRLIVISTMINWVSPNPKKHCFC
jgi:hypothetical protein